MVKIQNHLSCLWTLNIGAFKHYITVCCSTHSSNIIVTFANEIIMIGLISGCNKTAYLGEVEVLSKQFKNNSLGLKTKEAVGDFRKEKQMSPNTSGLMRPHRESDNSYRYLGVHIF